MPSYKLQRIESDIQKYLGNIILTETRDELLQSITITDVVLNKDLSLAKVYFTSISELENTEIEKEVNEASPYLRGKLAKVLDIRNIPELRFIYDKQIEYAKRLEEIITDINKKD